MSGRRARLERKSKSNITDENSSANLEATALGQPFVTARPDHNGTLKYVITPEYPSEHPLHGKISPTGSKGLYEVTFVLAIPGATTSFWDINFQEILERGDSLLEIPQEHSNLRVDIFPNKDSDTSENIVEFGTNEAHRLSNAKLLLNADNFNQASQKAHNTIMPILSRWAFQHDIAITTSAIHILEKKTGASQIALNVIGAVKHFSDSEGAGIQDSRILLSAYREALSASDVPYKALCYFKAIEGSYILRNRRKADLLSQSKSYTDPSEVMDNSLIKIANPRGRMMLEKEIAPFLGMKFTRLRDQFKNDIRHAIAHLDLDGNHLAADRYEDLKKVERALPAMHLMARVLMSAELNYSETN
jgi:hypothetical protein